MTYHEHLWKTKKNIYPENQADKTSGDTTFETFNLIYVNASCGFNIKLLSEYFSCFLFRFVTKCCLHFEIYLMFHDLYFRYFK